MRGSWDEAQNQIVYQYDYIVARTRPCTRTRLTLEETGARMMVCMEATSRDYTVIQCHRVLVPTGSPGPMLPSM